MENSDIFTITVIRNVGIPISFNIQRWKLLSILLITGVLIVSSLYFSVRFFLLYAENGVIREKLTTSEKSMEQLRTQILVKNNDLYAQGDGEHGDNKDTVKKVLLEQAKFSTEGIWVPPKVDSSLQDLAASTPVEIRRFNLSLKGDYLNISMRLYNVSEPSERVIGRVFITLVNNDNSPPTYRAMTKGEIGENGYPVSYHMGSSYNLSRANRYRTISTKVRLRDLKEYFTGVIIFVNSSSGQALIKQSFKIDKKLFLD